MELEEGMNNLCQDSPIFAFPLLTNSCGIRGEILHLTLRSPNHRMVWIGMDLYRSPSPTPLLWAGTTFNR